MDKTERSIEAAWFNQVARAFVAASFDPAPIYWKSNNEAGIQPVRRHCRKQEPGPHVLCKHLNRNDFLLGCHDFTERETVEHMIVGLGVRSSSTIRVHTLMHWVGGAHSVALPRGFLEFAERHIADARDNRLVIFHNHPKSSLDTLLDLTPIASVADRQVMLAQSLRPLVALKSLVAGKQIQWFVGQNGFVQEFDTPDIIGLMEAGARLLGNGQ